MQYFWRRGTRLTQFDVVDSTLEEGKDFRRTMSCTQQAVEIALDAPGARQIHHVKDLMLSRPYFSEFPIRA